jgi:hypothetical protein
MRWADIPFNPSARTLRQFAGLWIGFFLLLAVWQWWRGDSGLGAMALVVVALTVGPLGLVWPRLIRPIFVGWMVLAFPIGWLVSHVVVAGLYFGLFTPMAIVFRLMGRDALSLRKDQSSDSYWTVKPQVTDPRRYLRQF